MQLGSKRICKWLGHILNYDTNKLYVTETRMARLTASIQSVLYQINADKLNVISVRFLMSVVGQIISLQSVLGNLVKLKTK